MEEEGEEARSQGGVTDKEKLGCNTTPVSNRVEEGRTAWTIAVGAGASCVVTAGGAAAAAAGCGAATWGCCCCCTAGWLAWLAHKC